MNKELKTKLLNGDYPWQSFEQYPPNGVDVIIHLIGFVPKERKNYHDFALVAKFNAQTFDKTSYHNLPGAIWRYEWIKGSQLTSALK